MAKKNKLTTGEKLKDLRNKAGLTSEQLCDKLYEKYGYVINKSKYNYMENDKGQDFGYKAFVCLAKYYNVSVDYLLGLEESPTVDKDTKVVEKTTGLSAAAVSSICSLQKEFIPALDFTLQSKGFWKMLYTLYCAGCAKDYLYVKSRDNTVEVINKFMEDFDFKNQKIDRIKLDLVTTGIDPLYEFQLTKAASMLFDEYTEAL